MTDAEALVKREKLAKVVNDVLVLLNDDQTLTGRDLLDVVAWTYASILETLKAEPEDVKAALELLHCWVREICVHKNYARRELARPS